MADADACHRSGCGTKTGGDSKGGLMATWTRAAVLTLAIAATSGAQTWRNLDVSRQLRDTTEHRIKVKYAAGKFSMRPTSEPVLFSMQLRYDEERTHPVHDYDAESRSATLGVDGQIVRWTRHVNDNEVGEMRLGLSS